MKTRLVIPGLELYPDLIRRLNHEWARSGCTHCERATLTRKYSDLLEQRKSRRR